MGERRYSGGTEGAVGAFTEPCGEWAETRDDGEGGREGGREWAETTHIGQSPLAGRRRCAGS